MLVVGFVCLFWFVGGFVVVVWLVLVWFFVCLCFFIVLVFCLFVYFFTGRQSEERGEQRARGLYHSEDNP